MEELKSIDKLLLMDEKHRLMGAICGVVPSLDAMHEYLTRETLIDEVPEEIRNQFNVLRNMALYTYYFYALAAEVQHKSYTIIEYALRVRLKPEKRTMLHGLMQEAVSAELIQDSKFRHLKNPSTNNEWCKAMISGIPVLRNSQAHGSNALEGSCLHHVSLCADFINQLFATQSTQ